VLYPSFRNIQCSWVKLGREGAFEALRAGANDIGGVLMNESITRAAGGVNGQEMSESELVGIIRAAGRVPRERTTLYGTPQHSEWQEPWLRAGCLGETALGVSATEG
jgi:FO synthase